MQPKKNHKGRFVKFGAIGALMVVVAAWWWNHHNTDHAHPQKDASQASQTEAGTNISPELQGAFQKFDESLTGISSIGASSKSLQDLRSQLSAMPRDAAVAAIRKYLDSKTDLPTHMGFKVAANGLLDEAPTLRTFLMDELGRFDPAAAADYAKVVLSAKDSPDEWAVALRSLATGDATPAGRDLLLQKTSELLQYEPWQKDPSVGFLEAFDTAVFLGGTNLLPALSELVRKQDNSAVAHAAYLAMDRLVINDPAGTLAYMEGSPDMMNGRESTRANYFARADVRDPQQRQILENYLLNPNMNSAELSTFAGIYPNANFMISHNLLSDTKTPDHDSISGRDSQSLVVAQEWQDDPRFANRKAELQTIIRRLQTFVQQAQSPQSQLQPVSKDP